ncbi:CCA tRNA nucleotidyltransferase [Calothrix rhizosoleniae]|uniref:CCA tRNA nucleotidyltransferase n=1 Tax=Calothrix rhizosoleniae TaxID=888997 RepID=UPI000B49FDA3|nr:CCA tRNA nucleotidyltransferase [Calothrix rhizosoleniae]
MQGSVVSPFSPETWPFDLELLPQPVYMVGGAVRDGILGRSSEYLDLDFVLPSDAIQTARHIAKYYQAGFVILDPARKIARVVFPHATVDFAQQEGNSLATDLRRRDFTVNAIAYNPHTQEMIDPLQGCVDLDAKLLRMVSPDNLSDDPLRLLRAYRQASQLGFAIETNTQGIIRNLASNITQVALERVRVELGYLLASATGTPWLQTAWQDGLIQPFFPYANSESFSQLAAVDAAVVELAKTWQPLGLKIQGFIKDTVKTTWLGIAKLACLVHPEPDVAAAELNSLTYSRVEIRAVTTILKLAPQLKTNQMSLREQYFFFQEVGAVFPALAVFALAYNCSVEAIAPLISRYLNPDDLVAYPTPLVSGQDIMISLKIPPSPFIGELLTEIALAQVEGRVSTRNEAIELAASLEEGRREGVKE